MYLRVCWDVVPGRLFFWSSHIFGWGVDAVLLAVALAATGVSNRIGSTCLPNHPHTIADFWVWLIVFSGLAILLQLATSGYCTWIYIRNLVADRNFATNKTNFAGNDIVSKSSKPVSAKATWKNVRNALLSQWRGLAISILVIIEAGYFTAIFLREDALAASPMTPARIMGLETWAFCLIESGGDKNACLDQAKKFTLEPSTVLASVIVVAVRPLSIPHTLQPSTKSLIKLIGIEILLLLGRPSLIGGWLELLRCSGRRGQHVPQDESDAFVVSSRRPSRIAQTTDEFSPEPVGDLEKGFFDDPPPWQQHRHHTAAPLLPTPAVEDVNPFDMPIPPTPLPKDTPKAETFAQAQVANTKELGISEALGNVELAELSEGLERSPTKRRSRFLEARFSREEPGPLNFDTQTTREETQIPNAGRGPQESSSRPPRPTSSPNPTVPRVIVRSPSGPPRDRPLSGLWRSLSKRRRETAVDLKAGRGGLALNPVTKDDREEEKP